MDPLSQDQIKVLEQTRQRLVQLTHSLGSLVGSINHSDPLPPWSSLQSQASIISNNLQNVSQQLTTHHDLLSSLVAYPGENFPGQTQAPMLSQLVRTKLEPRVEDWVARGKGVGEGGGKGGVEGGGGGGCLLSDGELKELWSWAPIEANEEARGRDWGGDFTLEEREAGVKSVVTGLRRKLDEGGGEESSEGEEDEGVDGGTAGVPGDEMDIVGVHRKNVGAGVEFQVARERDHVPPQALSSAMPLDDVFRYMMTGVKRNM